MRDNQPEGVVDSVRRICDSGLALVQNRVELLGLEIREEKERLIHVLVLAAVVAFLVNMAALMVTVTIILLTEASAPVLIGLSVLYVAAAVAALLALRKNLHGARPPFSDTVSELEKDRECLKARN